MRFWRMGEHCSGSAPQVVGNDPGPDWPRIEPKSSPHGISITGSSMLGPKISPTGSSPQNGRPGIGLGRDSAFPAQHLWAHGFSRCIPRCVPPQRRVAVVRMVCNAWCTSRRFRDGDDGCLLGCGIEGSDAACCSWSARFGESEMKETLWACVGLWARGHAVPCSFPPSPSFLVVLRCFPSSISFCSHAPSRSTCCLSCLRGFSFAYSSHGVGARAWALCDETHLALFCHRICIHVSGFAFALVARSSASAPLRR